jgi:hypothetical protein
MPARNQRILIYPDEEGKPGQVMSFPLWWDHRGFFEKYGDRQIDTGHPIYVDYGLLLTPGEALEWDKQCRERFSISPMNMTIESDMQQMESALKNARWVIVESYEWESGLD